MGRGDHLKVKRKLKITEVLVIGKLVIMGVEVEREISEQT